MRDRALIVACNQPLPPAILIHSAKLFEIEGTFSLNARDLPLQTGFIYQQTSHQLHQQVVMGTRRIRQASHHFRNAEGPVLVSEYRFLSGLPDWATERYTTNPF